VVEAIGSSRKLPYTKEYRTRIRFRQIVGIVKI
jgi:hypothetical protein